MPPHRPDTTDDHAPASPSAGRRSLHPDRKLPLKWVVVTGIGLIVVLAAVVTTVSLVDWGGEDEGRAGEGAAGLEPVVTSPYDLVELPGNADLDRVGDAAFVSISMPNDKGTLTSYGISADLPNAEALARAIKHAEKVDPEEAPSTLTANAPAGSLTFVLPTRETLTFAFYLEQGLITRNDQVWQVEDDLKTLVQAVIAGPE